MECCYGWCHGTFGRARSSAAAVSLRHGASGLRYRVAAWPKSILRRRTMHRTDTLDCFVVVRGEIYLVSDTDEVLLRAGDTAVVQGVNHAWSNRSNEPALIVGIMTHPKPLPTEHYPPPRL